MLDMIAHSEGPYRGVAMVEAEVSEEELARLHAGGVRGVRFNFVSHLGKDGRFDAIRRSSPRSCARLARPWCISTPTGTSLKTFPDRAAAAHGDRTYGPRRMASRGQFEQEGRSSMLLVTDPGRSLLG